MAGGVERVLTLKANYFAEVFGYDITIITTDGEDAPSLLLRALRHVSSGSFAYKCEGS